MGRLLVVELLEASNIPQNIRRIKRLKVKPYIKASCPATGYEHITSIAEGDQSTSRWGTSFLMELQPVEVRGEEVVLSLFMQRSFKPDKLVATLKVPVADFAVEDSSSSAGTSSSAGENLPGTRTYEMNFESAKFLDKNGGTQITMKILARVEKNGPPIPPPKKKGLQAAGLGILGAVGTVVGVVGTVVDLEQVVGADAYDGD